MKKIIFAVAAAILFLSSCQESMDKLADRVFETARQQVLYQATLLTPELTPRSLDENGEFVTAGHQWWCSGFFPGTCWYVYEYTKDERVRALAIEKTDLLEHLKDDGPDHDIGFQVNCSFGNALRILSDSTRHDGEVLVTAANRLAGRFDPVVGCTKSWNGKNFRVIIDNMMNMELLMKAAELSGIDSLRNIAVSHTNTTMANHFRDDASSFHMLTYSPEDGSVLAKQTVQGYSDDSSWARGQAWGLYGFTMMYRFTLDEAYLDQAVRIADYIISRIPEDYVPFWDYDDPFLRDGTASEDPASEKFVPRDASAGAIQASAFAELSGFVTDKAKAKLYRNVAEETVRELATEKYLSQPKDNCGFILKHSTGHRMKNSEVDVPLSYADYYFLEAILRLVK